MSQPIAPNTRLKANPKHVQSAVRDEAVVLLIGKGEYYGLNAVGVRVWEILKTEHRFADLVDRIVSEYDVDRDTAVRDLTAIVSDLAGYGLVELSDGP